MGRSQAVRQRPLEPRCGGSNPPAPAMGKYYTYVLLSLKDHRFYIGQTNNLDDRVKRHSEGRVKATKNRRPLKLVYFVTFDSRSEAVRHERFLKSLNGNQRFKEIISYT